MVLIWRPGGEYVRAGMDTVSSMEHRFKNGIPVTFPWPNSTVTVHDDDVPVDFFDASVVVPLVSKRLRSLLEEFRVLAEYWQVTVEHKRVRDPEWYYINLLDAVNCIDLVQSKYEQHDYGFDIEDLIVDDSLAEGHHLFHIGEFPRIESNRWSVVEPIWGTSQELATAVIKSGFTGVFFCLPAHRRSYPESAVAWFPQ